MKKNLFVCLAIMCLCSCSKDSQDDVTGIVDGSGNVYSEVTVGSQVWLKEDLKTAKYIDGKEITASYYENKGKEGYYYLYDVDVKKLCPKGYRLPTQQDFQKMIEYFGGESIDKDQIISNYVNKWNGNPNGNGDGMTNAGSGLYWSSTQTTYPGKNGNYYFYFRTETAGLSVSQFSSIGSFHIKCIKE